MTTYQWLLFDADNTLFDFDATEEYALCRTLSHFGVQATDRIKNIYKKGNRALWDAFEQGKISQDRILAQRFTLFLEAAGLEGDGKAWNQFYMESLAGCSVLLPGAEDLCRRASQHYTLCLATNGVPFIQRSRLEHSPIARFFGGRVFISGEMGCRKPDKQFFETILTTLGAKNHRARVLVIGDSLSSDIRGAFNSQLDSVWLRWPSSQTGAVKPTYEVESLAQLGQLLNAHRLVPIRL